MKGFVLIEVLIALFILSLGLFGIAGMQLSALQHSQDAYWRSLATIQLSSLLERLRVNQSSAARNRELILWNAINVNLLPNGKGDYQCVGNFCMVKIHWTTKQTHMLSLSSYLK